MLLLLTEARDAHAVQQCRVSEPQWTQRPVKSKVTQSPMGLYKKKKKKGISTPLCPCASAVTAPDPCSHTQVFLQFSRPFGGPGEQPQSSPELRSSWPILYLVFSWLSITLTLQVCDFIILLLLQLGVLLVVGLQCLTMFQFQAVVLQLQVKQLLLDIFMLVLNTKRNQYN